MGRKPDLYAFLHAVLGLSATIPNVDQLASWISEVQKQEVKVITNTHRVVPLKHGLYERSLGFTTMRSIQKKYRRLASQSVTGRPEVEATTHLDLVRAIKDDYLPCLFFTFSRRKCEANALELGEEHDFLTKAQKREVTAVIDSVLGATLLWGVGAGLTCAACCLGNCLPPCGHASRTEGHCGGALYPPPNFGSLLHRNICGGAQLPLQDSLFRFQHQVGRGFL